MKILGIETSCDETAAALVEDGWKVHSNIITSSLELHKKTGGIVPEVAARDSALKITTVIDMALQKGEPDWDGIDAIAVTNGPGLLGSLLVGITAAKTLAFLYRKPLIPVFHIVGHLFSNLLEREKQPEFPILALTVAGGHNDLYLWKSIFEFQKLGETKDDAAGEAFDKGARMLGLPYPGGPHLSKLAESGDPNAIAFPRPLSQSDDYDFSFSGLKTALFYELRNREQESVDARHGARTTSSSLLPDLAASYQEAIVDTLIGKLFAAADKHKVREVHLAGGVSANKRLREKLAAESKKRGLKTRIPKKMEYCTDNAAMIAAAGHGMWQKNCSHVPWHVDSNEFSPEKTQVNLSHEFRF